MTSQSPRIYTYKITFEEVPYYYYGIHKEKRFNDEYWGSPKTNKWCWELYTPKKQVLELFDYTDEGWLKSQAIEKRLIRPFLNDEWCLNEGYGSNFSLKVLIKTGKKNGTKAYEERTGIHARTKEQMQEQGRKNGQKLYEERRGIHSLTFEERGEMGRKNGKKIYEEQKGMFSLTSEERSELSRKIGKKLHEDKKGIHSLTTEERIQNGKKTSSQVWECTITGYRANPGNLSKYQRARGIDTSKRERLH